MKSPRPEFHTQCGKQDGGVGTTGHYVENGHIGSRVINPVGILCATQMHCRYPVVGHVGSDPQAFNTIPLD